MLTEDSEIGENVPNTRDQVLEYVLLSSARASDALADRSRERVLEVTQVFGDSVLEVRHFRKERPVVVGGTATDFTVAVDELSQPTHPLFCHDGEGWVCSAEAAWPAFLESAAGRESFADLVACGRARRDAEGRVHVAFGEAERVVVHVGATSFCAQSVFPSKRAAPVKTDPDHGAAAVVGFVSFCAAMLGFALAFVPAPPKATTREIPESILVYLKPKEEQPKPEPVVGPQSVKKLVKAPGAEGEARRSDKDNPALRKQHLDQQAAQEAGVLGALRDDAALAAALGGTGLNSDLENGIKGLTAVRATSNGPGLGERGLDFGGGGKTASIGDFGPKARDGNPWGGGDFGTTKPGGNLKALTGEPIILGSLDKAQIDAVIKRNLQQIKYCYQRELQKTPGLTGKVTTKFVIAKDGSVSSATTKTSTLGNAGVESCINGRFLRFAFPEPKGGGIVVVSYPFVFSPG
jgi:hypothetical protein